MAKENPNAFKNWINEDMVQSLSGMIKKKYPSFADHEFKKVTKRLAPLELKGRVLLITDELKKHLPQDYKESLSILVAVIKEGKLRGFSLWPFSEYISKYGLDFYKESLEAMVVLTSHFTSEFAIRPFLQKDHKAVLEFLKPLANSKNHHVRRWVSEGTRPILPWGGNIQAFIKDPKYTLPLLDLLKHDEELYVRKSIANHLNDHSKNHPKTVIKILRDWEKSAPAQHQEKIQWIKKQALRTLIKKGDPDALKLMGVKGKAKIKAAKFALSKKAYKVGDTLSFSFELTSLAKQKLIIDYGIDFHKNNGKHSRKIFKLKNLDLNKGQKVVITKNHSLKPITTMKYYPGKHFVAIQVNGIVIKKLNWQLK